MCVDYRDLNKANLKDDFPLPHIDMLVDNTAKFKVFSFMDGFSGYNQIKMAPEDMEKTIFITPWGTFYYRVMLVGLKSAGATYQRAMTTLFHDMMHKEIKVYVDDMIAKSINEEEYVEHLLKLFQRLRKYKLRLNPKSVLLVFVLESCWALLLARRVLKLILPRSKQYKRCLRPKLRSKSEVFLAA